jgi:hypothetical protein
MTDPASDTPMFDPGGVSCKLSRREEVMCGRRSRRRCVQRRWEPTMADKRIEVAAEDRAVLEQIVRSRRAERRVFQRAQIVLLAAEGLSAPEISRRVGLGQAGQALARAL